MPEPERPTVTAGAAPPVVAICAGKDCRKRSEYSRVRAELERRRDVNDVESVGL